MLWIMSLKRRLYDWAQYNIYFCKATIFISGLILSHGFAENAVISTFVSYIPDYWEENVSKPAIIVNVGEGTSAIFRLFIVHISDACIGRFRIVLCTTVFFIIGLIILCFHPPFGLFYVAMLLITVGVAGRGPPLKAFLADQLIESEKIDTNNVDEDQIMARRQLWWNVAWFLGTMISVILAVIGSETLIIISTVVMGVAYLVFWSGISFFHHKKPTGSPLAIMYRVFKAATLKRNLNYPDSGNAYFKNDNNEVFLLPHIRFFRWLDKAAIPDSSFPDTEQQQRRLCTIGEVKLVKQLLALVPMWTAFFVYGLVEATARTFFVIQSDELDTSIGNGFRMPINAFLVLDLLADFTISNLFIMMIEKYWKSKENHHFATYAKIGIGMACSILCCFTAFKVEHSRLSYKHKMSIFWLTPQYVLLGLMKGLVEDGLCDFFCSHIDESMHSYESTINGCVLGVGNFLSAACIILSNSWFHDGINSSRLDKYYFMLGILSTANLCFYGIVAYQYGSKKAFPDLEQGHADSEIHLSPEQGRGDSAIHLSPEQGPGDSAIHSSTGRVRSFPSARFRSRTIQRFRTFTNVD